MTSSTTAFDATTQWCGSVNTRQLLIEVDDELVVEQYWQGADATSTQDCASIQKSATAVVLGQLVAEGIVDLGAPAADYLGSGWTRLEGEAEQAITVRHLITMSTGLDEYFDFDAPPGTHWYYNNNAYHRVRRLLELATGLDSNTLFTQRLFGPLQMTNSSFVPRPGSEDADGWPQSGLHTCARDLWRFGRAVLDRADLGCTDAFLDEMCSPSTTMNPSYGYLWWRLGGSSAVMPGNPPGRPVDPRHSFGRIEIDRPIAPEAPADTVAGFGMGDQRLYLVASANAVVVRLGLPHTEDPSGGSFDREFWSRCRPEIESYLP